MAAKRAECALPAEKMSLGMELSRRYWQQYGMPALRDHDPALFSRLAAGLIGEGSECFGYDDSISQDHDWGPGFCVWLNAQDFAVHREKLQQIYDALPDVFEGYHVKAIRSRVGIFETDAFFQRFIGRIPQKLTDWLILPEYALAVCTNGEVFHDPSGAFTATWQFLKAMPEPVRQKKLAARCVTMMQAGQYNLIRCRKRGDALSSAMAIQDFVQAAAGSMMLLHRQWAPFYKWLPASLRNLPQPAPQLTIQLEALVRTLGQYPPDEQLQDEYVESCCMIIANELRREGLTAVLGCDMQQIGLDIQSHISDDTLRSLPVLVG